MKIVNIIGARPQFMKYFPIQKAIEKFSDRFPITEILVNTGQHYDYSMSKVFFDQIGIKNPDHHLDIGSGSHGRQTSLIIERVEKILINENPDLVLVYGDTNSTLGAALASSKLHIPLGHIEAGLRSYNKLMPEEMNRIVTDHLSTFLFCPSQNAIENLSREGLNSSNLKPPTINAPVITNSGDIMYDMLIHTIDILDSKSSILEELSLTDRRYSLLTMHRAENVDDPGRFQTLIKYINETFASEQMVFPMHPRTRKVYGSMSTRFSENVRIVDPLGYFDITSLLKSARSLITDSGGMQKEAYWLKVPCITLRDETEWIETVESGWNILYKDYQGSHNTSDSFDGVYGSGKAGEKIMEIILNREL